MKDYLDKDPWKIVENSLHTDYNEVSESIASLGNGRLGGRGNFEERFNGPSLQGNYIAGVYYPDKTKVGWWKNGYPEYFAKVINSVNWIGMDVWIDGEDFELFPDQIKEFRAELDMKEGILRRTTVAELPNGKQIKIESERFYSMVDKDNAYLKYSLTPLNFSGEVCIAPYLDFNVINRDSNYEEGFWKRNDEGIDQRWGYVYSQTKKTAYHVLAGMKINTMLNGQSIALDYDAVKQNSFVEYQPKLKLNEGETFTIEKYCCICSSLYHEVSTLSESCQSQLEQSFEEGFEKAKIKHINKWDSIWNDCDISINGDVSAQQGIRFNIFQLYQTYNGDDARLNIGPKGFTGEKYGGVTYWDTEAYCLPFYLSTTDQSVAKNLLIYRYRHLQKAIENATKLGFSHGAALYPMVTMNGEECHNEWEITFEEIHRNGAIAYAIYDYIRYTGDNEHLKDYGLEVLIAISRFWRQRVNWSEPKQKFVILGVTGPNEYENNVNNNWYTNYIACWCMQYTMEAIAYVEQSHPEAYKNLCEKLDFNAKYESTRWQEIIDSMYLPSDKERAVFLQQDGFLDKNLMPAKNIPADEYPIHQNWSWDRILRSCFIKQADVLQGLYFFEDHFDKETIKRNFNFYEPLTVHESSLSPCVHAILAAKIGNYPKAYEMYLRTARLDLDDYNNDTKDGLHITSMAGTWMSVIKGFGGMRIINDTLSFDPFIPENWSSYSFKIKFRSHTLKLIVSHEGVNILNLSDEKIEILLKGQKQSIFPKEVQTIS